MAKKARKKGNMMAGRGKRSPRGGGMMPGMASMPGGMGGGQMQQAMSQMTKVQEDMEKLQLELADEEYSVSSGGGIVTATVNGKQEVLSLKISPEAVDPDDVDMLEDLVIAAINEALQKSNAVSEQRMGELTGDLNLPPGFGI